RLRDPEAIAFWPNGAGRDGARTPFPWSREGKGSGFTEADDAWLPIDPRHRSLAADAQEKDPGSVLATARRLIALRRASPALREGGYSAFDQALDRGGAVLAFARTAPGDRLLCIFNLGNEPVGLALGETARAVRLVLGEAELVGQDARLGAY